MWANDPEMAQKWEDEEKQGQVKERVVKITKTKLKQLIRETLLREEIQNPEEIMMSPKEIRDYVRRGDVIMAQAPVELARYEGESIAEWVVVPENEKLTVMAIGSGTGQDDVIATGRNVGDVVIPPWFLHNFMVWAEGPNR